MLNDLLEEPQRELLELFARAAARLGPVKRAPFVEPSQEFFPEAYEPTLVGAGQLLHRLLGLAGLDGELRVEDARAPLSEKSAEQFVVTHPEVTFIAAEKGRLVFQVDELGFGDLTVAALCHQVARAALPGDSDDLEL